MQRNDMKSRVFTYVLTLFVVTGMLVACDQSSDSSEGLTTASDGGSMMEAGDEMAEDPGGSQEDPSDPMDPIDDPSDPMDPVEDPADPVDPVEDPTDPVDPIEEPTDPVDPVENPTEPMMEYTVSYEEVQEIYNTRCVFCHHAPDFLEPSAGLVLVEDFSHEATVNVVSVQQPNGMLLIAPGNPDKSYLWHKINDTHLSKDGSGLGMPYGFLSSEYEPMPAEELQVIETWILEGALEVVPVGSVEDPSDPVEDPSDPVEDPTDPIEPTVSYAEVQAIYDRSCTFCHHSPDFIPTQWRSCFDRRVFL